MALETYLILILGVLDNGPCPVNAGDTAHPAVDHGGHCRGVGHGMLVVTILALDMTGQRGDVFLGVMGEAAAVANGRQFEMVSGCLLKFNSNVGGPDLAIMAIQDTVVLFRHIAQQPLLPSGIVTGMTVLAAILRYCLALVDGLDLGVPRPRIGTASGPGGSGGGVRGKGPILDIMTPKA